MTSCGTSFACPPLDAVGHPQHRIHPALLHPAEMFGSQSYDTLSCVNINRPMETV